VLKANKTKKLFLGNFAISSIWAISEIEEKLLLGNFAISSIWAISETEEKLLLGNFAISSIWAISAVLAKFCSSYGFLIIFTQNPIFQIPNSQTKFQKVFMGQNMFNTLKQT
jgi:hypothetical protein